MAPILTMLVAASLAAGETPDAHLLAGANHFRAARYGEALVEFREAQRLGARDAQGYAAATMVKLERYEEALELFESDTAGARGDALLQYYRAVACYETRMYVSADAQLAHVVERSGPRVSRQVSELRALIAAELQKEPAQAAIDWHVARCTDHQVVGHAALAAMYCREAVALAGRRTDRYGLARAERALASLESPPARAEVQR